MAAQILNDSSALAQRVSYTQERTRVSLNHRAEMEERIARTQRTISSSAAMITRSDILIVALRQACVGTCQPRQSPIP